MLSTNEQQKIIGALLKKEENLHCADCSGKSPCWASLDFGVFICMNCSGAHRALGPSITRVKSTKLDTWNKDWVANMQIGNSVLNEYWQAEIEVNMAVKPNINTPLTQIIKYVQDKYVKRKYIDRNQTNDPLTSYKQGNWKKNQKKKTVSPAPFVDIPKQQPKNTQQIKKTQPKVEVNLLTFEEVKKTKSDDIFKQFEFEERPRERKYSKSQFNTTAEIATGNKHLPPKHQTNFQSLISFTNEDQPKKAQHNHNQYQTHVNVHQNHFLGHQFHDHHQPALNLPVNSNNFGNFYQNPSESHTHNAYSLPSHLYSNAVGPNYNLPGNYDKNQYVTMNINMNMYPNVMNINMGSNQAPQLQKQPNQNFNKHPPNLHIDLSTNVNLAKEEPKQQNNLNNSSWADDWK